MSIINDALKKVQQSLTPKVDETPPAPPAETVQQPSGQLFETPPPVPVVDIDRQTVAQKPHQNTIKSILALICATVITAVSLWYLYQEFRDDIPHVQRLAKQSFYKLIHKEEVPDFKTRSPADLKPLAKITINPPTSTPANTVNPPTAEATLNIHGIMSDASGNVALINDRVYQEGDEVDGAKIVKIGLDSITVIINGVEQTISVKN